MSLFTAQLHPGRALGFMVLGASLHDILTRVKAEVQLFPKIDLIYSRTDPVRDPVVLGLPANGLRLRFDGPEQRLRLIEVVDFTKNHIFLKPANDKERDLVRPSSTPSGVSPASAEGATANTSTPTPTGPTFRHIYQRFLGPTYDGEYMPEVGGGMYVLSYPGVGFTFPMPRSEYSASKDVVSLLSSASVQVPTSMAVFSGDSWAQTRENLWTEPLPSIKAFAPLAKAAKDPTPDEVALARIHGGGRLQLLRRWSGASTWIALGETTPQQLVAELGPPDAVYRKNDQRMYIHKLRAASNTMGGGMAAARPSGEDLLLGTSGGSSNRNGNRNRNRNSSSSNRRRHDDLTDTDQSSAHTMSDDYDSNDDEAIEDDVAGGVAGECFYNYFYLGFDVLVSTPTAPSGGLPPSHSSRSRSSSHPSSSRDPPSSYSDVPPGMPENGHIKSASPDRLVATKVILHANVPGSYPFNRHRRCRWEIAYLNNNNNNNSNNTDSSDADDDDDDGIDSNDNYDSSSDNSIVNSEMPFSQIEERLRAAWKSEMDDGKRQRGMVLNRGWGDSPGSSCEFLGGWEESSGGRMTPGVSAAAAGAGGRGGVRKFDGGSEESTTTLYGFPGLVFEVLKNGFVSAVTVF